MIALRERGRHLLRLDPLDVAFLRRLPRRWLRLERVAGTRRHLVQVGGIAGTLLAPTGRATITPKVQPASLLALLDLHDPPPTTALPVGSDPGEELAERFAAAFASLLRQRVQAGLQRGYREQALAAPVLQGRLDVPAQLRHGPTRPEVLHQTVDTFSPDIPCNQLLRAALDELASVAGLSPETRGALHQLDATFAEVQPLARTAWFEPLLAPVEYGPVVDLARLLLAGSGGNAPGVGFIVELERLFEQHVLRGLQQAARPGLVIEPQARRVLRSARGPALVVQPDALILADGNPVQVIDAKWKRLRRGRPARADLFQILAYAETLNVPEAILVYPGRRDRCRSYPLTRGGTQVSVWTVVVGARSNAYARMLYGESGR